MMPMKKLQWIYNNHLNNYLWENGVRPAVEEEHRAGYRKTKHLAAAIEKYEIEFYIFPNRR